MAIFEEGVCCYMWYSVPVFSAGLVRIVVGMCVPPIVSAGSLDLLWGNGKYPTLKICSLCGVEKNHANLYSIDEKQQQKKSSRFHHACLIFFIQLLKALG